MLCWNDESFVAWKKLRRDKGGGSPTPFSHEKPSEGRSRRDTTRAAGGGKRGTKTTKCDTESQKKSPVAILNSYMRWFATAHFSSACAFRVHVPKFLPPTRVPVSPCIHYPDTKRPRSQCVIMLPSPLAGSPRFFLSFVFRFLCSVKGYV